MSSFTMPASSSHHMKSDAHSPRPAPTDNTQPGATGPMTFHPKHEDMPDFALFIKKTEDAGAHRRCGISKIIPPTGWTPRPSKTDYKDTNNAKLKWPLHQVITEYGQPGCYNLENNAFKDEMSLKEFAEMATTDEYRTPENLEGSAAIDYIWKNVTGTAALYGADTDGTIFDEDVSQFNLNSLDTILDEYKEVGEIAGVTSVYLYAGMFKSCFAWHAEDADLYSINYLHYGAPKYWYAIPAEAADQFEKVLDQYFPEKKAECPGHVRHKKCILSPDILKLHNIPFETMIQMPNEFIITYPRGYHMGFNLGYNLAEAINFAIERWVDFGINTERCLCKMAVNIDMEKFMEKYRKEDYAIWKKYGTKKGMIGPNISTPYPPRQDGTKQMAKASRRVVLKGEQGHWMSKQPELYCRTKPNFPAEIEENRKQSKYSPHCSVCQLFRLETHQNANSEGIPKRSKRLVKAQMFSKKAEHTEEADPREDILITCCNCEVTVHPSCYGGVVVGTKSWKCFRCRDRSDEAIAFTTCIICEKRAGAFLPCEFGSARGHIHVTCAIMHRRTGFDRDVGPTFCTTCPPDYYFLKKNVSELIAPEYLKAEDDLTEKFRNPCSLCNILQGGLIQCSLCEHSPPHERTLAHTTCAKQAGFSFEERDYPRNTAMICKKHIFNNHSDDKQMFMCKQKVKINADNNLIMGEVRGSVWTTCCAVTTMNGDYKEVKYEDVISCSCDQCQRGEHKFGAKLRICSTEEEPYDAYFRQTFTQICYEVQCEDQIRFTTEVIAPNDERVQLVRRTPGRKAKLSK